jgi:hypothetical protein
MDYHIKEILLDERFAQYRVVNGPSGKGRLLPNLSKVNILVGANNCGKSRLLRLLAGTEKLAFLPHFEGDAQALFIQLEDLRETFKHEFTHILELSDIDAPGLTKLLQQGDPIKYVQEEQGFTSSFIRALKVIPQQLHKDLTIKPGPNRRIGAMPEASRRLTELAKQTEDRIQACIEKLNPNYKFTKIYIPILRGLRDFEFLSGDEKQRKDPYAHRTIRDYFTDPHSCPEVWTGLTLYRGVQRLLLGNLDDREIIAEFQNFLSETFFDGQRIALIPKLDNTVLDIKVGEEVERPVYQLGDGIQSLILLTFPLFRNRGKKLLVFCEEPEMYMHPGMQRAFLKLLTSTEFPDYQYFLTTHSNHFLDLTLDFKDVSVYTFRKELEASDKKEKDAAFHIENVSSEDRCSLELLGVRNSSVFLSNCTIWVEGITDRRYFKHYLRLYQAHDPNRKPFREDWHYSFVEYGGSCITHWSFLDEGGDCIGVDRLCGKLFLIADGDPDTKWKPERHKKLEATLKDRFYRLKCKEVENLLSTTVLKAVLQQYGETSFKVFKQEDLQVARLGEFIEAAVIEGKRIRRGSYVDNGTVSDKVGFCDKAIRATKTFGDLSDEAKEIAKRLYDFIAASNK